MGLAPIIHLNSEKLITPSPFLSTTLIISSASSMLHTCTLLVKYLLIEWTIFYRPDSVQTSSRPLWCSRFRPCWTPWRSPWSWRPRPRPASASQPGWRRILAIQSYELEMIQHVVIVIKCLLWTCPRECNHSIMFRRIWRTFPYRNFAIQS